MISLTILKAALPLLLLITPSIIATPTAAAPLDIRDFCASEPPPGFVQAAAQMAKVENAANFKAAPVTAFALRVFMHVVSGSMALTDGYVSTSQLNSQFAVLRDRFAPYNITMVQGPISRTINASWTVDTPGTEIVMKRQLRRGDYRALNIYILKSPRSNSLGYCTFPFNVVPNSDNFFRDGCTVRYDTLPGGSQYNFNKGMTAVHETGHWFGLLHTFQGMNCTGSGDLISDTPAQLSATNGCPVGRDSCPGQYGLDPINNYMDYSIDSCYNNFSPGQKTRMFEMWNTYRASLYT